MNNKMKRGFAIASLCGILGVSVLTPQGRGFWNQLAPGQSLEMEAQAAVKKPSQVISAVKETMGSNYYPQTVYTKSNLMDLTKLTGSEVTSIAGEGPLMSGRFDKIIVVKAKKGQKAAVKKKLNAYKIAEQSNAFYPSHVLVAKTAKVVSKGRYVAYICLGSAATGETESQLFTAMKTMNQKAVTAFKNAF